MTYPIPSGGAPAAGFALGPADNIFGDSSGNAESIPFTVTPAETRTAAEGVRDAYALANPAWLAQYDANPRIGIFLFWTVVGDNLMLGQSRVGGQWVDQVSVTAVQGIPGSGTDFSGVGPNVIPAIGEGPDYIPYPSGLTVTPNAVEGAPNIIVTPGSLRVGISTLELEDQFKISGGGETLNFQASARDQWFTPVMNQMKSSGIARALIIEQSNPVTFVAQPVFDTAITNPDFVFTPTGGGLAAGWDGEVIHEFSVKTASAQANVMVELYIDGQTSPFWSQAYTTIAAGDATVPLESPLSLYFGQPYRLRIMGTNGNDVQILGNSSGVIYYAITGRLAKTTYAAQQNDFPWDEQLLASSPTITAANWHTFKGVRFLNNTTTNRTVTVAAGAMPALSDLGFRVTGTGSITFAPVDLIDGAASRVFTQGDTATVRYDGTTWTADYRAATPLTLGACLASRQSVTQNITSATDTRVLFNTVDALISTNIDQVGFVYDGVTNPGRFTNNSGRRVSVNVSYQILWQSNNTGRRQAWIRVNGTPGNRVAYELTPPVNGDATIQNGSATLALDNGQFFEVWCAHTAGPTLTIGGTAAGVDAGFGNRIQIVRVSQ